MQQKFKFLEHLKHIRTQMIKHGKPRYTSKEMAEITGLSQSYLWQILNYPVASNTFFITSKKKWARHWFLSDKYDSEGKKKM